MATYTDNYQLTKPTYAEQADIGVVNSNMNKIDEVMHSSQISLAPAYDQSQTYAEGDVVMYELLMYKCISPTTGVWDGSKWERTTASESGGGGSAELDILGEVSGAVASFSDGASAGLAKCIVEIVPKQAGSGTPSPDNVRTISGSTSATVTVSDGETSTTKTTPLGQTVYGGQLNVLTGELTIDRAIVDLGSFNWISENTTVSGLARVGVEEIRPLGALYNQTPICSSYEGVTPKGYTAFNNGEIGFSNNEANPMIRVRDQNFASMTDAQIKSAMNGVTLCYELATPQTVQLTPQEVNSLLGQNNISADTGDVDIVYVKASAPIQPNPTGTPTATLKKLGIEGTVFKLEGGGGGSSSEIHYSTTEKVVGTVEMDNGTIKPLYEKSWWLTIPSQSGGYTFPNTAMADLDQVISNEYSFGGRGMRSYTYWYTGASVVFDEHTSSGISFYFGSGDYGGLMIFYTARYTKITN